MKLLPKTLLGSVVLSGIMGLTACQNMPMSENKTANMPQGQVQNENLTENQILKVVSTANRGEILQAQVAMPKLQTAEARNFAQNMIAKHSENENKGQALGKSLGLAPQMSHTSNALQTDSNNVVAQLNGMSAPVDKAYIIKQIDVHNKVLMTIDNQLMPQAKTPQLRQFLAQIRSAVAMHLQVAQQLNARMR